MRSFYFNPNVYIQWLINYDNNNLYSLHKKHVYKGLSLNVYSGIVVHIQEKNLNLLKVKWNGI